MPEHKMTPQEERLSHAQAKAVEDCEKGEYKPPKDVVTEIFASENELQELHAYNTSYRNHRDQTQK